MRLATMVSTTLISLAIMNSPLWSQNPPPANLKVSVTTNPSADGYKYDYRFKNVGSQALMRLQVFTPEEQARGRMPSIRKCWVPKGWVGQVANNPQSTIVVWVSKGGAEIAPGRELGGFGFISDASPGTANLTASDVSMSMLSGQTTGPSVGPVAEAMEKSSPVSIDCEEN